uniref:Uncharacterized protein n=1 Tax=Anopheles coluzzii TaxID=1518534 RepID=A0A8W7PWY2_ANOCL
MPEAQPCADTNEAIPISRLSPPSCTVSGPPESPLHTDRPPVASRHTFWSDTRMMFQALTQAAFVMTGLLVYMTTSDAPGSASDVRPNPEAVPIMPANVRLSDRAGSSIGCTRSLKTAGEFRRTVAMSFRISVALKVAQQCNLVRELAGHRLLPVDDALRGPRVAQELQLRRQTLPVVIELVDRLHSRPVNVDPFGTGGRHHGQRYEQGCLHLCTHTLRFCGQSTRHRRACESEFCWIQSRKKEMRTQTDGAPEAQPAADTNEAMPTSRLRPPSCTASGPPESPLHGERPPVASRQTFCACTTAVLQKLLHWAFDRIGLRVNMTTGEVAVLASDVRPKPEAVPCTPAKVRASERAGRSIGWTRALKVAGVFRRTVAMSLRIVDGL